jgi:hypothetical protein
MANKSRFVTVLVSEGDMRNGEEGERIEERRNVREEMCRLAEHLQRTMSKFSWRCSKYSSLSRNIRRSNPYKKNPFFQY